MQARYFLWITATAILAMVVGCSSLSAGQQTMLDGNWGRSFESAKYNQILYPDAAEKNTAADGLDGLASEANTAKYRNSFAADTQPPASGANLGNIGQTTGGR